MASSQPDPGFWAGKSVSVTGGGGFLGRPTVALLGELGAEVRTVQAVWTDGSERRPLTNSRPRLTAVRATSRLSTRRLATPQGTR